MLYVSHGDMMNLSESFNKLLK